MFFKEQINPKNLRITLETLINIRWIAVIGQFFTVSFVYYGLKFQFPYFETIFITFCLSNPPAYEYASTAFPDAW